MNWVRTAIQFTLSLQRRWLGLWAGVILWLIWMLFGLWATLLLAVLATIGFVIGRVLEEHESWKEVVDKLLSDRYGD